MSRVLPVVLAILRRTRTPGPELSAGPAALTVVAFTDTRDTVAPAVRVGSSSFLGAAVSTGRLSTVPSLLGCGGSGAALLEGAAAVADALGAADDEAEGVALGAGAGALVAAGGGTSPDGAGSEHPAATRVIPARTPTRRPRGTVRGARGTTGLSSG
ncbi:hypothetical protein GCM10022197_34230 [Microlunatus spumicola]|uniref:Uncharacterized protein n=1 Tax=Microlunatus spumicola TaxID=81499 RepID=A0ABP6XXX4_9ACTN